MKVSYYSVGLIDENMVCGAMYFISNDLKFQAQTQYEFSYGQFLTLFYFNI